MTIFAYICRQDYGHAPNLADGHLTLATCKPVVRRCARENDYIIGFQQLKGQFPIYVCRVDRILDWPSYVDLCETTLTRKLQSAQNPQGDCYLDGTLQPRPGSDVTYHCCPKLRESDLRSPVLLSTTFLYWGDGTQDDNLPSFPWLKPLIREWGGPGPHWRGHRRICIRKFPDTARMFDSWLREHEPARFPWLWHGFYRGQPRNLTPTQPMLAGPAQVRYSSTCKQSC